MAAVPEAFGSYEGLLASPNVDAVYIPLPTGIRKSWVIQAAAAGKHVVCEKPCAVSVADLEEMLAACRRHRVQFMDGVMFAHSSRLAAMRRVLDDGKSVGSIRRIVTAFTFCGSESFRTENIRADGALEPHGCLGDLGWYCIRFILWAMNWKMPRSVEGRCIVRSRPGAGAVPMDFSGELLFDGGVSAGFSCSFSTALQQWAMVGGSLGRLVVRDFVLPAAGDRLEFEVARGVVISEGCDSKVKVGLRRHSVAEHSDGHATAQETRMFRNFADQVRSGKLNPFWPASSLKTQTVLNACSDSALRSVTGRR
jgi:predicted dehydrogenase